MKRGLTGAISCLAGLLLAGAVLLGCNDDSKPEPKPISGAPKQVAAVVERLEGATRRREFDVVCDQLFTSAARRRAGGRDCVTLLRTTAKDVRRPRIRVLNIRIAGKRAEARVRTLSEGQLAVEETIDLVRERGTYRIASLRG